ncbi:MAG: hypothetical protein M3347_10845, partial [Armatimonadota bacterium]|nr:hypothetical protein [Armatimonadota bacterium]
WELGFSDAAALVVNFLAQGSPANFDPSQLGVYLLPAYDLFNRPELGNPFFFSSGADGSTSLNLGFYRGGMAQAAWLKVYIENSNFFRLFNAAYYAQSATNAQLDQNTIALKLIAAGIVPTVEGQGFMDWYRRQHVLDTSVTTGDKLWFVARALPNLTTGDTLSVFQGIAQRYRTLANGDEQPLSGRGRVVALNEAGQDITALSTELNADNEVIFNEFGEAEVNLQHTAPNDIAVAGFRNTGTPDQGRITLVLRVDNSEAIAYFPYNVAGTVDNLSGFYGATLGTNNGTITVRVVAGSLATPSLTRGAFGSSLAYPSGPRVQTDFLLAPTDGAATKNFRRNSAWSVANGVVQSLAVLLETSPGNNPFNANWQTTGTNRLRMISLPFFPRETDEAAVLNVDPRTLLLARYRPNLSPGGFTAGGVQFGVTAARHELYPNISEPFAPGRGYWLKTGANLSRVVSGGEPARNQAYKVPLLGGWNQFGVPFNQALPLSAVQVQLVENNTETAAVSFASAVANGWINPGVWRWRPEGGYAPVAANQLLQPFEGYYIFAAKPRGVKLIFDLRTTSTSLTAPPASTSGWRLPLLATTAKASDIYNGFGVTALVAGKPQRMPVAKPPAGERTLTVSFLSGGTDAADATGAGGASGWAESLVEPFTRYAMWQFMVDGADPGQTVRLSWGNLATLPKRVELNLTDLTSGGYISMKQGSYAFVSSGGAQHFLIQATVRPALGNVTVRSAWGSRSATVLAEFLEAGRVTVDIMTSAERPVATLARQQEVQPGIRSWPWDGRSGRYAMPAGHYMAKVTFVDKGGTTYQKSISFFLY